MNHGRCSRQSPVVNFGLANDRGRTIGDGKLFFGGVAGCELFVAGFKPCSTEFEVAPPRDAMMESVIEVSMKITVDQVVALERTVADPRGPNAV